MKKTNAELMKYEKKLQMQIQDLLNYEHQYSKVSYMSNQTPEPSEYDYGDISKKILELQDEVRRIKGIINYSNATTIVPEYNISLGECLIKLAQMSKYIERLQSLYTGPQKTRNSLFSGVEYTDKCYDTEQVKADIYYYREEREKLQRAIDLVNLTHLIEI